MSETTEATATAPAPENQPNRKPTIFDLVRRPEEIITFTVPVPGAEDTEVDVEMWGPNGSTLLNYENTAFGLNGNAANRKKANTALLKQKFIGFKGLEVPAELLRPYGDNLARFLSEDPTFGQQLGAAIAAAYIDEIRIKVRKK